jgi:hypothetical protein
MSNGYTPTTEEVFSWMAARGAHTQEEFLRWYLGQLTVATDIGYQGAMRKAAELVRKYMPDDLKAYVVAELLDSVADDIVPGED